MSFDFRERKASPLLCHHPTTPVFPPLHRLIRFFPFSFLFSPFFLSFFFSFFLFFFCFVSSRFLLAPHLSPTRRASSQDTHKRRKTPRPWSNSAQFARLPSCRRSVDEREEAGRKSIIFRMKYSSEIRDRCSSAEHVFNTFIYRRRPIGDKTRLLLVQTEGLLVALWLTTSPQPRQANDLNSLSCELIKPNPPDLVPRHIVASTC